MAEHAPRGGRIKQRGIEIQHAFELRGGLGQLERQVERGDSRVEIEWGDLQPLQASDDFGEIS